MTRHRTTSCRSRWRLRRPVPTTSEIDWHRRGPHDATFALAKPLRRAGDRHHPPPASRPHDRPERGTSPPSIAQLFSASTTARGRISRSRRMRPSRAPSSDLSTAVWSPYPTSAASTTAIPPSGVVLILPPPAAKRSAISARDGFAASGTDYGRSRSTPWPAARRPSACSTTRYDRRGLDRRDRVLANDGVLHVRRTHRGLVNVGSVVHHCVPELAVVDC
jgi:hypothetical protein